MTKIPDLFGEEKFEFY